MTGNDMSSYNNSHTGGQNSNNKTAPLPPIEECLFGQSRRCPPLSDDNEPPQSPIAEGGGGDNPDTPSSMNSSSGAGGDDFYDSFGAGGHWGNAAFKHDINIQQLRRIASQGIADEGSHRAVAWRVLLGFLPCRDISETWKTTLPEQRMLYDSLVKEYFDGRRDYGEDLRGYHSRKLRNRKLRRKFHQVERLDYDSDEEEGEGGGTTEEELQKMRMMAEDDRDDSMSDHMGGEGSDYFMTGQCNMLDRLPAKFKEQWKKSGIDLEGNKNTSGQGCNVALGVNQLKLPELLEETDEDKFLDFMDSARLLEEIRKDVVRTHPDLYFFLEPKNNLGSRRYAAIERILFIWSRLNKGVRYVQGMNEIVGTIYYVLANDVNGQWATEAEADTYYLFNALMVEMRDVFVPDMDDADTGIQGRITNMENLLSTHDPALQEHLQECGIDSSFYAIRWLTTLLSREFLLPDTIRLWDSMFASTHKENFLRYVCGTMVLMIREELLKGDFSSCLRLLQRYPPANIDNILESSRALWIYESQITMACHKGGISLHQALSTISPPPAIVIAFGIRGGFDARRSSVDEKSAENESKAHATSEEGLLGRAIKLWNGWGSPPSAASSTAASSSDTTSTTPASKQPVGASDSESTSAGLEADTGQSRPRSLTSPPQPRAWNRLRTNTADTNDSTTSAGEAAGSSTGDSTFRSRLWNRAFNSGATQEASATATTSGDAAMVGAEAPRSRLWNRRGPSPVPPNANDASTTPATSTWTLPPKPRAWRIRGAEKEEQHTPGISSIATARSPVDPMMPPTANRSHMADVMEILSS